jgi:ribosome-dependent ATPase
MRGCSTLEEAFISYMKDDIARNAIAETDDKKQNVPFMLKSKRVIKHGRLFDIYRLAALARRESIELFRDPIRLITAFIISPFLLIVFGFGISTDIENIKYSIIDNDQKLYSREYLENFSSSRYFSEQKSIHSHAELDKGFQSGKFNMVVEIPPGFEKDIKRGKSPSVGLWIDGTMPFRAETTKNYAEAVHLSYLADLVGRSPIPVVTSSTHVQPRYWYNPLIKSKYSIVPGLLATVLMLVPAMLTAIGVVREKELGSITNFYSSPMTRLEFLWGKQIPYIVITTITFIILLGVIKFLFNIPFKGSFPALVTGAMLYIIISTSIGLLISTFTKTQIASLVAAFVITMVPCFDFSGLTTPASTLTGGANFMSRVFPARYFLNISVGTFTKGIGFSELVWNFVFLIMIYMTIQIMTVFLLKKQEK